MLKPTTPTRRFDSLDEWLSWLATLHPKQIDMSLDRVSGVLAALGIAKPSYRVVSVAGTNGKGSCVALLEAVYRAAGYSVGTFMSPHLVRFNERIRFDGRDLDDDVLVDLFARIDAARGDLTLSYFEASAVAAMLHFELAGADVGVLEVGMGGRLDAVNALDADAALIVSIDLDHMEWLGPDRDAIGREKAGIARAGRPVIIADREPPAGLLDAVRARGADAFLIGADFDALPHALGFEYRQPGQSSQTYPLPGFGGRIQRDNAAAVVAVVAALGTELPVSPEAIAAGIGQARLRGRFERIGVDGREWIFDVAHNPAAARQFRDALSTLPAAPRTTAVFGAMRDKDLDRVLELFVGDVDHWFVGGVDSDRGAAPDELAGRLRRLGAKAVSVYAETAMAAAAARDDDADRVLVFGSFYSVGPAMQVVGIY